MRYLFFLPVLFLACSDELLDRTPRNSVSPETFFRTESDLELYTNGLLDIPSGYDIYLSDQSSDNAATTGAVEIKTIMTGNANSQNLTGGWDWERLREINYFLANYGRATVPDEVANHYAGLARLYRAQFYYDKVRRYSDVPYYDEVLNVTDQELLYKSQDPRSEVVDRILEDLAFATEHVREEVPQGTPDRYVALMWQARIALHEGTYRKYHPELSLEDTADEFLQLAAEAAEAVMESGRFALYTTGNPERDYLELFVSQSLAGNPEIIQYDWNDFGLGEEAGFRFQLQDYELSPSRDLVQAYLTESGEPFTATEGYQTAGFVAEFTDRDPRLSQTLAYPGWINRAEGQTTPYVQELNKNFTGYHLIKGFVNSTDEATIQSVDVPTIRYAEALLIFAEARAELGELTQEDLDRSVNLLRARVGMPPVVLAEVQNDIDPVQQARYPEVTGADAGAILAVRRERRIELAFEGHRFDDLMRWHAGDLLEDIPEGIYFPGLGRYDLTGDGVDDIQLIALSETVPEGDARETNSLGVPLIYYRTGPFGSEATVYLENGEGGGATVTDDSDREFTEPLHYYRPVPFNEVILNPNLTQPFGWQ
jgi:hypothetical protein